jgi:DNA primase small subunit
LQKLEIEASTLMNYLLPRLDSHVSIQLNHLLKTPYCIHPDTGKLCIPLSLELVEAFDPSAVPTLTNLVLDLKESGSAQLPGMELWQKFCSSSD